MRKRRLALTMMLSVALAVLVSACGAALGPVQFSASGPMVSPILPDWRGLAGIHQRATAHAMQHVQDFVAPEQTMTFETMGVHFCHGEP